MSESIKKDTIHGVCWRILETAGTQLIQLFISIVLARLILPEQFAAIAMLTIFTAIASTFINSGFSNALIRKVNRTQIDCSTVFYFNIVVSIISYIILFFSAPFIADFYNLQELKIILRVSSITLIIGSFAGVHRTLFTARMEFKPLAKFNVLALTISGIIGIVMAYHNFQVWSLVFQSIVSTLIVTICIWIKSPWRPSYEFSWTSFREFFNFGSKLLASGLLDTIYVNMQSVAIGKFFPHADLAFYNRAESLKNLSSSTPTSVLQSVTFPALCRLQKSDEVLQSGYRRLIQISSFVVFPMCLIIGAVAFPLINFLYSSTWIASANLLQILVFAGMWYPIHAINLNLLQVRGRTDLFFKLEVIKKIIGVAVLCITLPLGLEAMCYGGIVTSIVCLIINTHYTGKILGLGFAEQMRDIWPSLALSLVMFASCNTLATIMGNDFVSLIVSIGAGVIIYLGGAYTFKFKEIELLKSMRNKN